MSNYKLPKEEVEKFREEFDEQSMFPEGEEREISWKDQLRIHKKFKSKLSPRLRLLWEYLQRESINSPLNKEKITQKLEMPLKSLDSYLCELNRYIKTRFIRWNHVKGMKGFIEPIGKNPENDIYVLRKRKKKEVSELTRTDQVEQLVKAGEEEYSIEKKKQKAKKIIKEIEDEGKEKVSN